MSIQLITHQEHLGAIPIVFLEEGLYLVCPINGGATLRDDGFAPRGQGFCKQKNVGGAIALILIVRRRWLSGAGGSGGRVSLTNCTGCSSIQITGSSGV
jgi:hypothetical protein